MNQPTTTVKTHQHKNRRTAVVLGIVVAAFFFGVMLRKAFHPQFLQWLS